MKKTGILALAVLLANLGLNQQVCAAGYAMTGTHVWGECGSGQIPTVTDMTVAFSTLENSLSIAIEAAKIDIVAAIKGQTEVMRVLFEQNFASETKRAKQLEAERVKYESKRRLMAQSPNNCVGRDAASSGASGKKAAEEQRAEQNKKYAEKGEGIASDAEEAREGIRQAALEADLKEEIPRGDMIIPPSGLLDEDNIRKSTAITRLVTDPHPNPKVEARGTHAGDEARTEQRVKQSRLALAVDTLNAITSWHSPNTDASLVREYAKEAGMSESHIQFYVPEVNGHTSMAVFLNTIGTMGRTLNPNWHNKIIAETEELALLKELVQINAMRLFVETQNNQWLQRIAGLLATQVSIDVETSNPRILSNLYTPGVSPVAGQGD